MRAPQKLTLPDDLYTSEFFVSTSRGVEMNENKVLQWAMVICLLSMAAGTLALVAIVGGKL